MSKGQNIQDPFLNAVRKERTPVSIFLVNGIKLQGTVDSFDQFVVMLKSTVSQMVYKHAISTIVPSKPVNIQNTQGQNANQYDLYQIRCRCFLTGQILVSEHCSFT